MAISIDGYIAKTDWDSDWVSEADIDIFDKLIKKSWWIILWHKTFEQYKWILYPVRWVQNIVISSTQNEKEIDTSFVKNTDEALQVGQKNNLNQVLLIGWGITNTSFIKENKIDEIILSIHPIILGTGIKLFENIEIEKKLNFISSKSLNEELVQIHYSVKK